VPDILSHFYKNWIFSYFHEVLNNMCHGIPSSGAVLIHVDTWTDMPKAKGASHDCECT